MSTPEQRAEWHRLNQMKNDNQWTRYRLRWAVPVLRADPGDPPLSGPSVYATVQVKA